MARVKTTELLRTSQSWDGARLPVFPSENGEIVAMKYEFPPGEKLGWHHHDVINFGVVEQGELTIIDIHGHVKVVHAGEALVEMVGTIHHGENNGNETVVLHMFSTSHRRAHPCRCSTPKSRLSDCEPRLMQVHQRRA